MGAAAPCCGGRMIIVETFDGAAPRALAIADPDQDRHLAIILTLPASLCLSPSPPLAPEQERDVLTTSADLPPAAAPTPTARILAPEKARRVRSLTITPAALHPRRHIGDPSADPKNPHRSRPAKTAPLPSRGFFPYEAFGRRPRAQSQQRLQRAAVRNPFSYEEPGSPITLLVSVNSDLPDRVHSRPTSYPVGSCDPEP